MDKFQQLFKPLLAILFIVSTLLLILHFDPRSGFFNSTFFWSVYIGVIVGLFIYAYTEIVKVLPRWFFMNLFLFPVLISENRVIIALGLFYLIFIIGMTIYFKFIKPHKNAPKNKKKQ